MVHFLSSIWPMKAFFFKWVILKTSIWRTKGDIFLDVEEKSIPGRGDNKYKRSQTGTGLEYITGEGWIKERWGKTGNQGLPFSLWFLKTHNNDFCVYANYGGKSLYMFVKEYWPLGSECIIVRHCCRARGRQTR